MGRIMQFLDRLDSGPRALLLILVAIMLFASGIVVGQALASAT